MNRRFSPPDMGPRHAATPADTHHGAADSPAGAGDDAGGGHDMTQMRGMTRSQMQMGDAGEMSDTDRQKMQEQHHASTLWVYLILVALGVWLIGSPATFGYRDLATVEGGVARVTAARGLPAIAARSVALTWSDVIAGALLVLFGLLALNPRRSWALWLACLVGVWLLFAPLVLWSPRAAAFVNETLVGILVIALTVLIPDMPGMMLIMKHGPEIPPDWSYNPSAWPQRAPIIALAFFGFFLSRYLSAYQLGYITRVWDPFFGDGTMRILDSNVSRAWPISDAGLGAVSYLIEGLMGFMGGKDRWRTMPWMVTFFGILVVPLGATSIVLVILQPLMVGTWCTICLVTAAAMLFMIPLTLDEVVAMAQFLVRRVREGRSFWHTFWLGDTVAGGGEDARTPSFGAPLAQSMAASVWGMSVPWTTVAAAALGIWLMASPAVFGMRGAAADSAHLVGALIVSFSVIAIAEVGRAIRFLNLPLGVWTIAAPWFLGGMSAAAIASSLLVGAAVILASLPRGPVRERYAGWQRAAL